MPRTHVLVELVCLVHFVSFSLLSIQPPLQKLRVVLRERLVAVFNLSEFELESADFIVKDL